MSARPRQSGQSLVEGSVALLALLMLWVAIAWLARFQDMALQASHASRFAAFSLTRHSEANPVDHIRQHYFSGSAHQWADRRGGLILRGGDSEVVLNVTRSRHLTADSQPGGHMSNSTDLRKGWGLEDTGVVNAVVKVDPAMPKHLPRGGLGSLGIGLRQFDGMYPGLARHTSILTGGGHASSDIDVQHRVAGSGLGWRDGSEYSYQEGRRVSSRMQAVDQGWDRPAPQWDWLNPWAGEVPAFHLNAYGGGHK